MPKIVIGMFRRPKDRLLSSFLDQWHHEGMPHNSWLVLKNSLTNLLFRNFTQAVESGDRETQAQVRLAMAKEYILHDDMLGCYTKMLNGHRCVSDFLKRSEPFNFEALKFALERLRKFYFVGIFEEYNKSISALHILANNGLSRPHTVSCIFQRRYY